MRDVVVAEIAVLAEYRDTYSFNDMMCEFGQWPAEEEWQVMQNPAELRCMLRIFRALRPTRIVEIGTGLGGTLFYWLRNMTADASVITVDCNRERQAIAHTNVGHDERVAFVCAPSVSVKAVNEVYRRMPVVDFLFIDGCHSKEAAAADYRIYGRLVQNGIVAFHDIVLPMVGVGAAWNEVKETEDNTFEIIANPQAMPHKMPVGIGLKIKGDI